MAGHRQVEGRDLMKTGTQKKRMFIFPWGPPEQRSYEFPSLGREGGVMPFSTPLPPAWLNFSMKHSTSSRSWSYLHQTLPLCTSWGIFIRTGLWASTVDLSVRRPTQAPYMDQVSWSWNAPKHQLQSMDIGNMLNGKNMQARILYLASLSFRIEGDIVSKTIKN